MTSGEGYKGTVTVGFSPTPSKNQTEKRVVNISILEQQGVEIQGIFISKTGAETLDNPITIGGFLYPDKLKVHI